MAWLWQRDIDDEKREPAAIFRLRHMVSAKAPGLAKAGEHVASLGIPRGARVLDFGCGTGHYALAAARAVGRDGFVHAADAHPAALDIIERDAARMNLQNIETIFTDLETGLDDASVDAVLLFNVLGGRRDVKALLSEMRRVLKPGGLLHVRSPELKNGRLELMLMKDGLFRLSARSGEFASFSRVDGGFQEI